MPLERNVKFYFCSKHPKITTADAEGDVVSILVLKSVCPFPKNQNCPFIFQKCPFFPRSVFLFNVCVCFSNVFFSQVIVLSTCPAESCSEKLHLRALKNSTWSMISYVFYSSFIFYDSLENTISEDFSVSEIKLFESI